MMGIKTEGNKVFCKECSKELKMKASQVIFNFCPFCGSPLNLLSYNLNKEKEKIIKLKTIREVQKIITDSDDLKKIIYLINTIN